MWISSVNTGDPVGSRCAEWFIILGHVSLQGELVRLQMQKRLKIRDDFIAQYFWESYRVANPKRYGTLGRVLKTEKSRAFIVPDKSSRRVGFEEKMIWYRVQADNAKATFLLFCWGSGDFRGIDSQSLAESFRIRVEMKTE